MNEYRYILEPYKGRSTRYDCPVCGKRQEFTRYIDRETGQYLSENVGKCNREINCGYHYTPRQHFENNTIAIHSPDKSFQVGMYARAERSGNVAFKKPSFMERKVFEKSQLNFEENNFVRYLIKLFGQSVTNKVIARYNIGTAKHWPGATVFWQLDIAGNIRAGKIMLYNPESGKRVKEPYNHITWAHSALKIENFSLQQCLFGEHLLQDEPHKSIAIVESEKTAVIASIYLPQFIWLAVGSLTNLTVEKCKILGGRNVYLFPDLFCYEKWSARAKELSYLASVKVSDLLETKASPEEKKEGLDLADFLVRFNYKTFPQQESQPKSVLESMKIKNPAIENLIETLKLELVW